MSTVSPRQATHSQRRLLYIRDRGKCHYCDTVLKTSEFHADHKLAWSRGGETELVNLVVSCRMCNVAKHTMSYDRFKNLLEDKGLGWRRRRFFAIINFYTT